MPPWRRRRRPLGLSYRSTIIVAFLSSRPETQKPAKAHDALRVFDPGAFVPLTLSLWHKQKNKSRTFFRKLEKTSDKNSLSRKRFVFQYVMNLVPSPIKAARRINPAGGQVDPCLSGHWEFSSRQDHADLA